MTFPFVHYYNKLLSPTSILECNSHKIKIHVYFVSEHFEFRHFRPHYLNVDTIFGDLRRECLHQPLLHVVRNTIFRKAPPSVVSGYGKRSINLNKVVATFEKHIFLSQTDLTRTGIISNSYNEMFEA
jgi:hypothetical protein